MRYCALSVDLDEIPHYYGIHGLPVPATQQHPVYDLALPRILEFAEELGLKCTLFVVASDARRQANRELLRAAITRGHEIGNHSKDHLYDLVRRPPDEQHEQVVGGAEMLAEYVGVRPVGFRAPGYTISDALVERIVEGGHRYDSSVFPCPPYYAAKALTLALQRLTRRSSMAILDQPLVLTAPTRPYRMGQPYTRAGGGLLELPIQVTPGVRLPYIGTGLVLAGNLGAQALTELVCGEPFVNLELHGIDFLGRGDGLTLLERVQPDLRVSFAKKRQIFTAVVRKLRNAAYTFRRLDQVAAEL